MKKYMYDTEMQSYIECKVIDKELFDIDGEIVGKEEIDDFYLGQDVKPKSLGICKVVIPIEDDDYE